MNRLIIRQKRITVTTTMKNVDGIEPDKKNCEGTKVKHTDEIQNVKGIRIRTINIIIMGIICVVFLQLIWTTHKSFCYYQDLENSTRSFTLSQEAAAQMRETIDYLTEQVREFAVHGETGYVDAYFKEVNETKRRDEALQFFEKLGVDEKTEEELREIMGCSQGLAQIEYHSMRLAALAHDVDVERLPDAVKNIVLSEAELSMTKEKQQMRAIEMVFNDEYNWQKSTIYYHLDEMIKKEMLLLEHRMKQDSNELHESLLRQRVMIIVFFLADLFRFALMVFFVIHPLRRYIKSIQQHRRIDVKGTYEFKYLALTYNEFYEKNEERKALLEYKAEHDKLSGVLNRTAFDSITKYLSGQTGELALLVIDIDSFKTVNDSFGHETGDLVIKKVAGILQSQMRSQDKIARYGGDEFVVLMMEIADSDEQVIDRKIKHINNILTNPTDGLPSVSISVGVAFSKNGYHEKLFAQADKALYCAKNAGKNCCRFYKGTNIPE